MNKLRSSLLVAMICASSLSVMAKPPEIVMMWPNETSPTIELTLAKIDRVNSWAGGHSYFSEAIVKNLTKTPLARATFTIYFFDKQNVRIGNATLIMRNLDPDQEVKSRLRFSAVGPPVTAALHDAAIVPQTVKTVPLKVISVPAGAHLRVDDLDQGVTPKTVSLAVGTHTVELSKDGYAPSSNSVEIKGDEPPGKKLNVELTRTSDDVIELRDGSMLSGKVISLSASEVVFSTKGETRTIDRKRIKKLILAEQPNAPK
jgi:hypothetical protein